MRKINQRTKLYQPMPIYPLISPKERLAIWEKVRGMWKNRKPDPIKELEKMRREWEKRLPSLKK
jgi:hypothetical protein